MTTGSLADLRSRLYEAYATQHADVAGDQTAAHVYRRDIRPLLPPPTVTALAPGGVLVARVPKAVRPFGGHIRDGDFTHQTSFTARSIHQLAGAARKGEVVVDPGAKMISEITQAGSPA